MSDKNPTDYVAEHPPRVNPDALRRPAKHRRASLYRDHPHTGGRDGCVARLRKRKKRR